MVKSEISMNCLASYWQVDRLERILGRQTTLAFHSEYFFRIRQ